MKNLIFLLVISTSICAFAADKNAVQVSYGMDGSWVVDGEGANAIHKVLINQFGNLKKLSWKVGSATSPSTQLLSQYCYEFFNKSEGMKAIMEIQSIAQNLKETKIELVDACQ